MTVSRGQVVGYGLGICHTGRTPGVRCCRGGIGCGVDHLLVERIARALCDAAGWAEAPDRYCGWDYEPYKDEWIRRAEEIVAG